MTVERDAFTISKTGDDLFAEISESDIEKAAADVVKNVSG